MARQLRRRNRKTCSFAEYKKALRQLPEGLLGLRLYKRGGAKTQTRSQQEWPPAVLAFVIPLRLCDFAYLGCGLQLVNLTTFQRVLYSSRSRFSS